MKHHGLKIESNRAFFLLLLVFFHVDMGFRLIDTLTGSRGKCDRCI